MNETTKTATDTQEDKNPMFVTSDRVSEALELLRRHAFMKSVERTNAAARLSHKSGTDDMMDFVFEYVGENEKVEFYSLAHYGEQNGDLMRDPEIVMGRTKCDSRWFATSYRSDYLGVEFCYISFDGLGNIESFQPQFIMDANGFVTDWIASILEDWDWSQVQKDLDADK